MFLLTGGPTSWVRHNSFSSAVRDVQAWSRWGPAFGAGGGIGWRYDNCYGRSCGPGCALWEIADWGLLDGCNGSDALEGEDAWAMVGSIAPVLLTVQAATANSVTVDGTHRTDWRRLLCVTFETGQAAGITRRIVGNLGGHFTLQRPFPGATPAAGDKVWLHTAMSSWHPGGGKPDGWWHKSGQLKVRDGNIEDTRWGGVVTRYPSRVDMDGMRYFPNSRKPAHLYQLQGGAGSSLILGGNHVVEVSDPTTSGFPIQTVGAVPIVGDALPSQLRSVRRVDTNTSANIAPRISL
jgi:hypothetical protein